MSTGSIKSYASTVSSVSTATSSTSSPVKEQQNHMLGVHCPYSPSPNSRGLIKKRGLAIFPEEINREGVNKWKWVDFVMQC